jgi:paraquat-inducible protein B
MSGTDGSASAHFVAQVRRTWWPGWIWSVPIAAIGVIGWLLIRWLTTGGTDITITFDDAHGVKPDTDVVCRGTTIGGVTEVSLIDDGTRVAVKAHIDESAAPLLRSGTRFWLEGAHPSIGNPASLAAVLGGPTIVMAPGAGPKTTEFAGLDRKPIGPPDERHAQHVRVAFARGDVGALNAGDPVTLRGFPVGTVEQVELHVDARTGAIAMPVMLEIFPSLLHLELPPEPAGDTAPSRAVDALVARGLRARLAQNPPLIGAYAVTLDMVPDAPPAEPAMADGTPEIPTLEGGGIDSLIDRLGSVPIEQIGDHVLAITRRVDTLVASPELADAIAQLDAVLRRVQQTVADAGPRISQMVTALQHTADQLDRTAKSADTLLGGPASQAGLTTTLEEATDAARAIRELADYLDRHPEALIRGRGRQ